MVPTTIASPMTWCAWCRASQARDQNQSVNQFFQGLEDLGFQAEMAQLNPILRLFTDFVNDLPQWACDGWTPRELFERYGRYGR